jgi:hypothetical protein
MPSSSAHLTATCLHMHARTHSLTSLRTRRFAGASFEGDVNRGQTSYYGCTDLRVQGGEGVGQRPACPSFQPGDAHTPASQNACMFFGQPEPMRCSPDGCGGSYAKGLPGPLSRCLAKGGA